MLNVKQFIAKVQRYLFEEWRAWWQYEFIYNYWCLLRFGLRLFRFFRFFRFCRFWRFWLLFWVDFTPVQTCSLRDFWIFLRTSFARPLHSVMCSRTNFLLSKIIFIFINYKINCHIKIIFFLPLIKYFHKMLNWF